ncbi:unnamed protein product [Owenia fusiformis]|uniref:Uncharacterized protein n=1 Tax=Owenia fusiformis TaxID=6347 RepID=A0A8J1TYK6_OWEFU|nr:unnamed protein product [Owenia fusiformis]
MQAVISVNILIILFGQRAELAKTRPKRLFKHVIHIGVDGLKPGCIANATGGAPTFRKLGEDGSWTHTKARTVIQTSSGPAWTAALCGLSPRMSGVRNNHWKVPWIKSLNFTPQIPPITGLDEPFPCIFETIKKQDKDVQTAFFFSWTWFQNLGNTGIRGNYIDHEVDVGYGSTRAEYRESDELVAGNATEYIKNVLRKKAKSYSFIYLNFIDETGHLSRWCSQEYEDAVGVVDNLVGDIVEAIETTPELKDDTMIIVHSDHGAIFNDSGHQFKESIEALLIPVYLTGSGIKKAYEMQKNIWIEDMPQTVMFALGLNPHDVWRGKPMEEAFETEVIDLCPSCGWLSHSKWTWIIILTGSLLLLNV